jgi:hypothetical protein
MPKIISYFFYGFSCRRLLVLFTDTIATTKKRREESTKRGDPEDEAEARKLEALIKAAETLDEECKKLAYWSDVRELARDDKMLRATEQEPSQTELESSKALTPESDAQEEEEQGVDVEQDKGDEQGAFEREFNNDDLFEETQRSTQDESEEVELPGSWVDGAQETEESQEVGSTQALETQETQETQEIVEDWEQAEDEDGLQEVEPLPEGSQETTS